MSIEKFFTKFGGVTEEYRFYADTIELRYDPKDHVYLLVTPTGELEPQDGVTSIVHIIDKSSALIPWGCKMMAQKIMAEAPIITTPDGARRLGYLDLESFEKLVMEGKSAHKEKLEEAAHVGHTAHDWIEQYIKAVLATNGSRIEELLAKMPEEPRAQNCCVAALDWMQAHNVRWISTERKIYSKFYQYAGTLDGLALVDSCSDPECRGCRGHEPFKDRLTVVDWKSSNYLYLEYLYQTAAYMQAYNEEKLYEHANGALTTEGVAKTATDRWVIRLGKDDGEFDPWYAPAETFNDDWRGFRSALDLTRAVRRTEARIADAKAAEKARLKAIKDAQKAAQDAQKAAQDELERVEKAHIKAEKAQARLDALAKACPKSKKYKGSRPPTCTTNGGFPCEACQTIYEKVQQSKIANPSEKVLDDLKDEAGDEDTDQDGLEAQTCPCGCGRDIDTPCPNMNGTAVLTELLHQEA